MSQTTASRRTLLRAGGAAVAAAATANAATVTSAQEAYGGWLDDTENYDGTVDFRGEDEIEVAVGAGNGLLFDPPAILVDPGATVTWVWTGEGGSHNVVDDDGAYGSELQDEEGATFEHTFEEEGVSRYYCEPHESTGMKGVVAVGEVEEAQEDLVDGEGEAGSDGEGDGDSEGGDGDGEGGDGGEGNGDSEGGDGESGDGGEDGEDGGGEEGEAEESDLRELTTADYVTIALALAFGLGLLLPLMYAAANAEIE